jgi:hypothetical protein
LLAGILGALAAATRNFGVFLLIPLGYEWLRHRREFGWSGAWKIALVPTGLVAYIIFLWDRFGYPLLFFSAQRSPVWRRELTDPVTALMLAWEKADRGLKHLLDEMRRSNQKDDLPVRPVANSVGVLINNGDEGDV